MPAPEIPVSQKTSGAAAPLVFWLTGISGAGKTTIATRFKQRAAAAAWPAVVPDGDAAGGRPHAGAGLCDAARGGTVQRSAGDAEGDDGTGAG
ncbi:adenylyl-sulfate kinase, partial [Burkholderia pseudomallei]|uniref:adenylyl-sulfate kinase n=1 Tax=Burkholderia pseudomallei TaxID=28450 RepID=UPI003F6865D8